jgi:hypothetical protein
MHHRGIAGVDLFACEADAVEALGGAALKLVERFPGLLGYVHCGSCCCFAVATKVTCELTIPPDHEVYSVECTKWVKLPLTYNMNTGFRESREEQENTKLLGELDLKELHFYYCETYDITHRYPNANTPCLHEDKNFVWNERITQHFQEVGIRYLCTVLLQGLAMSLKTTEGDLMNEVEVALIVRWRRAIQLHDIWDVVSAIPLGLGMRQSASCFCGPDGTKLLTPRPMFRTW